MAKLFPGSRKGLLFAAQIDLPEAIGESAKTQSLLASARGAMDPRTAATLPTKSTRTDHKAGAAEPETSNFEP